MILRYRLFFYFIAILFSVHWSFCSEYCNSTTCCYPNGIGCFTNDPPFHDLPLPEDPAKIAPVFWLYTLKNGSLSGNWSFEPRVVIDPNEVDVSHLVVLTHGFEGNMVNTPWHNSIIEQLLKINPKLNILFIDWAKGADKWFTFSGYKQAASNTRIAGAITMVFLSNNSHFDAAKVHCIGFSLGAHVCGFAAKRGNFKWQRVSAIEPAKYYFNTPDKRARVDKSDGIFVDSVHTSTIAGVQFPIGHVDLWVNGGKHQPGCSRFFLQSKADLEAVHTTSIFDYIERYFGCSHTRGAILYYLSIDPPAGCSFKPFCPCPTNSHSNSANATCPPEQQQIFGYNVLKTRQGNFCGNTEPKPPYYTCK